MKKFISIFLLLCITILLIPNKSNASFVSKPNLIIENAEIPVLISGQENTINFILKNIGDTKAKEIRMTPIFQDDKVFKLNSLTSSSELLDIGNGKEMPVELKVIVSPDAAPGDYVIKLLFEYKYTEIHYSTGGVSSIFETEGSKEIPIYVRIDDVNSAPRLIISSFSTDPNVIVPGQDFKLNVMYENKGTLPTSNVTVKIEGLSNDGIYLASGSDTQFIKKVDGRSVSNLNFHLKTANNIKKGGYKLDVIFIYNGLKDTQSIYLNVGGVNDQSSNLLIENIIEPKTSVRPNQDFTIKFDLRNNGSIKAKNVLVKVESTDSAIIPKSTSIKRINEIMPNDKVTLEFVFSPTQEAISKNYPISINVEYEDDLNLPGEKRPAINQYAGVYVDNEDSTSKSKPRLIIDKYSFEPQLVRAGENFQMKLSFYNTSSTKTVKNIKIFLTAEPGGTSGDSPNAGGSVFTPVDSSNTFYIDSIPPKGRVEKTITMFTVPDALAKTHTIIANFEYEDNEGNPLEDQERIGVPVVQQSKLDTSELTVYPDTMVGQPTPVSLEFYNTGKVTLYNLMVKLEGDFQTENGSYYVGNFPSGSSDYFEGMVIPNQPGEVKGAVVFTYEDSTGEIQEVRKEFTLNVMDMPPMEEFPSDVPPIDDYNPNGGGIKNILKSKWLWITLVVIAAAVGGVVFYRKKKRAKEMGLDE